MTISLLGDAVYALVIPLWVVRSTGSATAVAVVTGSGVLINLVVAPVAGTIADRTERRRVMIAADVLRGVTVLVMAAGLQVGAVGIAHLAIAAAALAIAAAFFSPAYATAQSGLVHPQDLTRALSLFQMMRQTVAFVGPSLAGLVVAGAGNAAALGLDAVSFFVSAALVAVVRLRWDAGERANRHPFWHDFRAGITTVIGNLAVRRIVILSLGVNFAGAMFGVILPVVAVREWGLSPARFGLFNSLSPAGVLLGLLIVSLLSRRLVRRGRFMLQALLAMGLLNLSLGWATGFVPFGILLFLAGVAFGLSNVMFAALYRTLVPQAQQGRFFGLLGAMSQALVPLGLGLAGLLADTASPFAVAAGAGAVVLSLAIWGLGSPGLRDVT